MTFDQKKSGASDAVPHGDGSGSASFYSRLSPFYFELVREAEKLGLDDLGLARVSLARTFDVFQEYLREGRNAGMTWLSDNSDARRSPRSVLKEAETLIVVALSEKRIRDESVEITNEIFSSSELQSREGLSEESRHGEISGYATCLDYHDVMRKRLKALGKFVKERFPDAVVRPAVDTAPILEKDWAVAAGLGFCGLNTLTINPRLGSRFFLGELLVSTPLERLCGLSTTQEYLQARRELCVVKGEKEFDAEKETRRCLSCHRCVDACPTNALLGDRTLDARRCLNYWTIENRDEIPDDVAQLLDGRLFGCDLCQRVCPHNAHIEAASPRELPLDAVERLDEETFRRLFKKTPVFRARVDGLKRVAQNLRKIDDQNETK